MKNQTITIKVPVPPQLLTLYHKKTGYTEKQALMDFQFTIQTLIDKMFPKIFTTLNDAILAMETEKSEN